VEGPEDYRWNSLGDYIQIGNQVSLRELHQASLKEFGILDPDERLKPHRRYVYEVGAINRSGKPAAGVIDTGGLERERKNDFDLKRLRRFRYRTRYFTDSGIIDPKEFVSGNYRKFKDPLCLTAIRQC